jgi:hypothetical protein
MSTSPDPIFVKSVVVTLIRPTKVHSVRIVFLRFSYSINVGELELKRGELLLDPVLAEEDAAELFVVVFVFTTEVISPLNIMDNGSSKSALIVVVMPFFFFSFFTS